MFQLEEQGWEDVEADDEHKHQPSYSCDSLIDPRSILQTQI